MKWEQIESKWALMTRRIRADWDCDRIETTGASVRTLKRPDPLKATIADSRNSAVKDSELKTSAR
jgi:hypothetical protein